MVKNGAGNLGIAAKFIIQSNGNYYYYDTKNNFDLFSYNLTDTLSTFSISRFCHKQYYSEICLELDFIICSSNKYGHDNSLVEYYFTIPNEFLHENLYANSDVEIIFQNKFEIRMNEYFSPSISVDDKYIGIACYDEKGVGYATTGQYKDSHTREFLQISMKGQRAITDPEWSKTNGKLSTFYAQPYYDNNGKQIGEVVSVVDATIAYSLK